MPHFFRDNAKTDGKRLASVLSLDHMPKVGDGGCVELVKAFSDLRGRASTSWMQGSRVIDLANLTPGTAIATFYNGRWPGWHSGNHAAFFVRVSDRVGRKPETVAGHVSMSNSLEYFYVIE